MKGIIVLDEIPKSCVDCPMCYHSGDMSIGNFKYERIYRCKLEPEEIEDGYLCDILHKKPDWCPIKPMPKRKTGRSLPEYDTDIHYEIGWNSCIDVIIGER